MKAYSKFSIRKSAVIDCIPPVVQHYYSSGGHVQVEFIANGVDDRRSLKTKLSRDEAFDLAMNLLQGVAYLDRKAK